MVQEKYVFVCMFTLSWCEGKAERWKAKDHTWHTICPKMGSWHWKSLSLLRSKPQVSRCESTDKKLCLKLIFSYEGIGFGILPAVKWHVSVAEYILGQIWCLAVGALFLVWLWALRVFVKSLWQTAADHPASGRLMLTGWHKAEIFQSAFKLIHFSNQKGN